MAKTKTRLAIPKGDRFLSTSQTNTGTEKIPTPPSKPLPRFFPGYQIILESAYAVASPEATADQIADLVHNLMARKHELIPEAHKSEVMTAVVAVTNQPDFMIQLRHRNSLLEFADYQIGKEQFTALLEDSDWMIKDCCHGIGYSLFMRNLEEY